MVIPNNTVIRIDEIGEDNAALICQTDLRPCCSSPPNRYGQWYYPDGTLVANFAAGQNFYRGRGDDGVVRLNRRNNAQSPPGIYTCEVPDNSRRIQRLIVGVVSQDGMFVKTNPGLVFEILADTIVIMLQGYFHTMIILMSIAYPVIVGHPKDALQVDPGSDVTFSVVARLSTGYLWKLNGTNLVDGVKYVGSRRSSLTVRDVQESDEGEYTCVVGNQLVSVTSGRARLTLCKLPFLLYLDCVCVCVCVCSCLHVYVQVMCVPSSTQYRPHTAVSAVLCQHRH